MISVIIPSYNHEKFIERCVDSVLAQTYRDWELIIIDDGSRDSSNAILAGYAARDPRITHLQQENRGAHATINRGLALARGEFLTILNSDDEFLPERFEKCLAAFAARPDVMLVSTWIDVVDVDSKVLGTKMGWENMEPWPIANKDASFAGTDDYALNALMANFVSTTSNMIFRRSLYERVGGMRNLRFAHDWDFLLRVCSQYECLSLPDALMYYRIHGSNTISSNRKWMLFEVCWILAANIDLFARRLLPDIGSETFAKSHMQMLESFNLQGNDHIFWLLYWHISQLRQKNVLNPEEVYLADANLRNKIIDFVKD